MRRPPKPTRHAGTLWSLFVAILFGFASVPTHAQKPVTINSQGWSISADPSRGSLNVLHESLGPILQNVSLNLNDSRELSKTIGWSVEKTSESLLTIYTVQPRGAWVFSIGRNELWISTTFPDAVLTGEAPAPLDRIPSRLLDPEGFPVEWVGTNEAMLEYGGEETRNQAYLPRKNPDVMYFAIGLVSGSGFHALFDRQSDIAIEFPDQTILRRSDENRTLLNFRFAVPGNAALRLVPDYYTKILGAPFFAPLDDSYFRTAPMVWSSWTGYYEDVTEDDIVRNTDWLAKNLKPYGFQFVQLDDGYDRQKNGEHGWVETWDTKKFPHGPRWLTAYIRSKGLRAGLWLVPNSYAGALKHHPEWYVRSQDGELINDYKTPVLDSSNPGVLAFLKTLFTTLNSWGFEYYKFDGEGSIPQAMPELDRSKLFDGFSDPVLAYRKRVKVIRETIGPHTFVEECPAGMPLNAIGYYNSFFNGNDLYDNWQGMYPLFSSINGNAFFNHIFGYVMPGEGLELGTPMSIEDAMKTRRPGAIREIVNRESPVTGVGVTDAEARTLVSLISLTGVAYPVGNVMLDLPPERVKLLQLTMPTMPIVPLDLFSRGTDSRIATFRTERPDYYVHNYPEILDLKVQAAAGTYDVVGLTNWRSESTTRRISLVEKVGLDPGASYIVFDFWNQKFLGIINDELEAEIGAHDTRVLSIHPLLNRPQLIGNSRHISGAYSILEQHWDESKSTLSGTSETVPGDPYTLWFHLPKGVSLASARAEVQDHTIAPQIAMKDGALTISFAGQGQSVNWTLEFTGVAVE
jgi:Melibiase/Alpha galactosidase C-terminal beta sandwich domain